MNVIAAILYDPATAASASTEALLAMTAIDTTNLRHSVIPTPPSGRLHVRMRFALDIGLGAGLPAILVGVMSGSTVLARVAPKIIAGNAYRAMAEAEFTVSGLAPASFVTLDAAYAVQIEEVGTAIAFGGPDDNAGDNAYGGFLFEIFSDSADELAATTPERTNDAGSY